MSSYHILNSTGTGANYSTRIEYHINVPIEVNPYTSEADYLRTRLQGDSEYKKISEDPNISAAEQQNINQGEIVIVHEWISINGDRPDHLATLDSFASTRLAELRTEAVQQLRDKYRYTSLVRDIP